MTEDDLLKLSELMSEGYRMREKQLDRMITLYEQGEGLHVESERRLRDIFDKVILTAKPSVSVG